MCPSHQPSFDWNTGPVKRQLRRGGGSGALQTGPKILIFRNLYAITRLLEKTRVGPLRRRNIHPSKRLLNHPTARIRAPERAREWIAGSEVPSTPDLPTQSSDRSAQVRRRVFFVPRKRRISSPPSLIGRLPILVSDHLPIFT